MNYVFHLAIFTIVLLVYLHVQSHFRHAPDDKVLEMDGVVPMSGRIDDVLDLKQPVIFRHQSHDTVNDMEHELNIHELVRKFGDADVHVSSSASSAGSSSSTRVAASLTSFAELQRREYDPDSSITGYYSDGNANTLVNRMALAQIERCYSELLAPPMTCTKIYDVMFGTKHSVTAMQRTVAHRAYFTVTNGTLEAVLVHPDKMGSVISSTISTVTEHAVDAMTTTYAVPSRPSNQEDEFAKKGVTLYKGQTLFVPPYWGVKFRFCGANTFVLVAKFSTYLSEVATCAHTGKYWYTAMTARPTIVPDAHVPSSSAPSNEMENASPIVAEVPDVVEEVEKAKDGANDTSMNCENSIIEKVDPVDTSPTCEENASAS